jgi:hypothetical protein
LYEPMDGFGQSQSSKEQAIFLGRAT